MAKIRVLKPFVFSYAGEPGVDKLAKEHQFAVGTHEVPDHIASHPWIQSLADGHIEDEGKVERDAAAAAAAQKARDDADAAKIQAIVDVAVKAKLKEMGLDDDGSKPKK